VDRSKVLLLCAGVLAVVVAVVYGWSLIFKERVLSADELAELALTAHSPEQQEEAAAKLAALGKPAQPQMKRVLGESKTPSVRAAMITELASEYAYDTMPTMLDALDDDSLLVRVRAFWAMDRLLQYKFGYQAEDPREKRQAAIKAYRDLWEKVKDKPRLKELQERGAEKTVPSPRTGD